MVLLVYFVADAKEWNSISFMNEKLNKLQKQSSFNFESTALRKFSFASRRLTENILAIVASDNSLSMAENDGSFVAAPPLDVHEVWVGSGDWLPEFVGFSLCFKGGV